MRINFFKRMCQVVAFIFLVRSVSIVQAQGLDNIRTKVIDGFYIGVTGGDFTTANTSINDKLSFCIWRTATNNFDHVYFPTSPEYIYKIRLLSADGISLPKTVIGKEVGAKFDDLEPTFDPSKGYQLTIEKVMSGQASGYRCLFFPFKPGHGGKPFYSTSDLFVISKPGKYTLEIYFQFIVKTGSGEDKTAHLVRFPPLYYPLIKAR